MKGLYKFLSIKILFLLLALSACSNYHYRSPESISDKIARYRASRSYDYNAIPNTKELKVYRKNRRSLASSQKKFKSKYSSRGLYFLVFLSQYEMLKDYLNNQELPDIKSCPQFHSILLTYRNKKNKFSSSERKIGHLKKEYKNFFNYPELLLSTVQEEEAPTIADLLQNKTDLLKNKEKVRSLISNALKIHTFKMYKELEVLCDHGRSINYDNYKNLLAYIQRQGSRFSPSQKNTKVLLRSSVFFNKILMDSLSVHQTKSQYFDHLTNQFSLEWIKDYSP